MNKNTNNGLFLVFKVIVVISFLTIVTSTVIYFVESSKGEMSFFSKHFAVGLDLFLIGIMAILMPKLAAKSLQGENKGDKMMGVVGLLLFLFAILTVVFSFVK